MATQISSPARQLLVAQSVRSLSQAANKWREAQVNFINARYAFDQKRFSNRLEEAQMRAAYKQASEAARAAMSAYYAAVDLANKTSAMVV